MPNKVFITAALPYANGQIHFGHIAGAYLPGDCCARFHRSRGDEVLYLCGSDEYGVAITIAAEIAGRTPQAHVDHFHQLNQKIFSQMEISFDHFSRTTWSGHVPIVQQFFLDLLQRGWIEERVTPQLFSPQENRFLADRYVVGECPRCGAGGARGDECLKCGASYEATDLQNPRSKLTGSLLVPTPTKHWFLLFDRLKEPLLQWLNSKTWKPNVMNFARNYADNLQPRAITRDGTWGVPIPLPGTEGKVLYVWFDAPIGYISATQEWAQLQGDPEAWKSYWLDPNTQYFQFIGKDNIPFHALFFPAMVMGQPVPYKLVDQLVANEFLLLEGKQFSKSEGWTIDIAEFLTQFKSDQIRYCLAAHAPETQDAEFTWADFQLRCNRELLGKYGNFAHRVLMFLHNTCQGRIPAVSWDSEFIEQLRCKLEEIGRAYGACQLRKATALMMEIAQMGNVYFDMHQPWRLAKTAETYPQMERVIVTCLKCLECLAMASAPVIPSTARQLWRLLGHATALDDIRWDAVLTIPMRPGAVLARPDVLFQPVEDQTITLWESQLRPCAPGH